MTDKPEWEMSDEALAKLSPAAMLARNLMVSEPEDPAAALQALFGTVDPTDEQIETVANDLGGELEEAVRSTDGKILRKDPMFPDRPDHADFWELSEVILRQDAAADNHEPLETILRDFDYESARYMAQQRGKRFMDLVKGGMEKGETNLELVMISMWMDGFVGGLQIGRSRAEDSMSDGSHRGQR